jgi:hypothetical protein
MINSPAHANAIIPVSNSTVGSVSPGDRAKEVEAIWEVGRNFSMVVDPSMSWLKIDRPMVATVRLIAMATVLARLSM